MTNFIINPENGKIVSIFSQNGKRILNNYLWTLKQRGGSIKPPPPPPGSRVDDDDAVLGPAPVDTHSDEKKGEEKRERVAVLPRPQLVRQQQVVFASVTTSVGQATTSSFASATTSVGQATTSSFATG